MHIFFHKILFYTVRFIHVICFHYHVPRLYILYAFYPFVFGPIPGMVNIDCLSIVHMMTSWNGNVIRITGSLWEESTGTQWIPSQRVSNAKLWYFLWWWPLTHQYSSMRTRCTTFPNEFLWAKIIYLDFEFSQNLFQGALTICQSTLVQLGTKPLPEPMMIKFSDACIYLFMFRSLYRNIPPIIQTYIQYQALKYWNVIVRI